jgi:lysozyme
MTISSNPILDKLRKPLLALTVTAAATAGISKHEGFREAAYTPVVGDVATIGGGTTVYPDGSRVKIGDKITRKQAEEYLMHDLGKFSTAIKSCVKVPLSQNEFDAYLSLTYNIGSNAFCKSTLVKKLNTFDYEGACKQILIWDKFNGKALRGLSERRKQEYDLCIKP